MQRAPRVRFVKWAAIVAIFAVTFFCVAILWQGKDRITFSSFQEIKIGTPLSEIEKKLGKGMDALDTPVDELNVRQTGPVSIDGPFFPDKDHPDDAPDYCLVWPGQGGEITLRIDGDNRVMAKSYIPYLPATLTEYVRFYFGLFN